MEEHKEPDGTTIKERIIEYILNCNNENNHLVNMVIERQGEMDQNDILLAAVALVYIFLFKNTVVFRSNGDEALRNYASVWRLYRENHPEQSSLPGDYLGKIKPSETDDANEMFRIAYKWHIIIVEWMLTGDESKLSGIPFLDKELVVKRFWKVFRAEPRTSFQKLQFVTQLDANIEDDYTSIKANIQSNNFPIFLPLEHTEVPNARQIGQLFTKLMHYEDGL